MLLCRENGSVEGGQIIFFMHLICFSQLYIPLRNGSKFSSYISSLTDTVGGECDVNCTNQFKTHLSKRYSMKIDSGMPRGIIADKGKPLARLSLNSHSPTPRWTAVLRGICISRQMVDYMHGLDAQTVTEHRSLLYCSWPCRDLSKFGMTELLGHSPREAQWHDLKPDPCILEDSRMAKTRSSDTRDNHSLYPRNEMSDIVQGIKGETWTS